MFRQVFRTNKLLTVGRDRTTIHIPVAYFAARNTFVETIFDKDPDPAPKFFSLDVQSLLKRLTRPDFAKVFRKRVSRSTALHKMQRLKTPQYKFLTTEQLEEEITKAQDKAERLLQMPPVVKIREEVDKVLSRDVALTGLDTSKYVFTDISFGISNEKRMVVERDTNGTLHYADNQTKKRMNQIYFPLDGRKINTPPMFTDEEKLYSLLDRGEYEFLLNRACVQFDPDEPTFQKVTSIAYQHVDANKNYHMLRSTRHFGPFVFYLAWHRSIDGLMLELLQSGNIREAVCLVALRHSLHGDITQGDEVTALAQQITRLPIEPPSPDNITEEDIQLNERCIEIVNRYIANNSAMKGLQELALQTLRETHKQQVMLSRGLRKAHGTA